MKNAQAANAVCALIEAIGGDYAVSDASDPAPRFVDAAQVQADAALAAAMGMTVGVEDDIEGPGWAVTVRTSTGALYARYMYVG